MRDFGVLVRRQRQRRGLTLRALSDRIGMAVPHLSALERGRRVPPVDAQRLTGLADALGLVEGEERDGLLDAACRPGELPADLRHLAARRDVLSLLRAIDRGNISAREVERLLPSVVTPEGSDHDG